MNSPVCKTAIELFRRAASHERAEILDLRAPVQSSPQVLLNLPKTADSNGKYRLGELSCPCTASPVSPTFVKTVVLA